MVLLADLDHRGEKTYEHVTIKAALATSEINFTDMANVVFIVRAP